MDEFKGATSSSVKFQRRRSSGAVLTSDQRSKTNNTTSRQLIDDNDNDNLQLQQQQQMNEPRQQKCVCLPNNYAPSQFTTVWSELRSKQQLCDSVIRCADGQEFPVHRLVLSAVSPYFRALFTSQLTGATADSKHELAMVPEIDAETLKLMLEYAYTGACVIDVNNVERLLPVADRFEVLGLVQLCCQFLLDELNFDNCLGIYKFARHYFCRDLEERGRRYIRQNFKHIYQHSPEFKELTWEELEPILRDDELNVRSEELVFEALKSWAESRPNERAQHLSKLLYSVRYGLMNVQYFRENVLTWKLAQNNENAKSVLSSIKAYVDKRERRHQTCRPNLKDNLARPRVPYEVLFAMGGWCCNWIINYVETYDVRANRWLGSTCKDTTPLAYHGLCALDNLIYVIGGFDGRRFFNTMRCFDPATEKWTEKACMHHARCYVSVCAHDGKIYAIGGNNGLSRMNSCERYDPEANQWEPIAPMYMPRSDASAAALNGKIYVTGGYDGYQINDSVEVYDIKTGLWSFLAPMGSVRTGLSLVAHQGCLYAIGGFDGFARLNSCEKYDPDRQQDGWQEIAEMKSRRSNFTTAVLDDMIFAMGGYEDPQTLSRVEYYDAEKNEWREASPMILGRSALSACVVAGIVNARKHTYHQFANKS